MADPGADLADQVLRSIQAAAQRRDDPFLTAREVAELAHCGQDTAKRWLRQRRVAWRRVGRQRLYVRNDVFRHLGVSVPADQNDDAAGWRAANDAMRSKQ